MSKSFQNDTIKPKGYQKWLGVLIKWCHALSNLQKPKLNALRKRYCKWTVNWGIQNGFLIVKKFGHWKC
jgi:hypothetical protein